MKNIILLFLFALFLTSCGTTKNTGKIPAPIVGSTETKPKPTRKVQPKTNEAAKSVTTSESKITEEPIEDARQIKKELIDYAKTFEGTRYKFGGTTDAGMDCSGLVYTVFQKESITLPRISRDMATKGILISFKDIAEGDLVFFKTSSRNSINHVGLVVETKRGEVKFIHSTIKAGVIISSLEEAYWKKAFVEVRRVI